MDERYLFLALIDGLNVCSLTLLTLFVSLMFTLNVQRRTILLLGTAYIVGVFIAYTSTGLGILLFSLSLPTVPHFLARLGVSAMLIIGLVNVANYFLPFKIPTMIPTSLGSKSIIYMKGATFPSVAFAGVLSGLHNFPCACTGGVYMTFISLISGSPFQIPYLVGYNLIFLLPMLIILSVTSSKAVALRVRRWNQENGEKTRFGIGIAMILVALVLLTAILSGSTGH